MGDVLAVMDGDLDAGSGDFRPPELLPLLYTGEKIVDHESEPQQDQTQSNRDVEVTLAGFKHRSRRQNASFAPMLPPTIIDAPTSEITPPKPAMTAASSGNFASLHNSHNSCAFDAPIPSNCSASFGSRAWKLAIVKPATMGNAMTTWAITIAVGE